MDIIYRTVTQSTIKCKAVYNEGGELKSEELEDVVVESRRVGISYARKIVDEKYKDRVIKGQNIFIDKIDYNQKVYKMNIEEFVKYAEEA